MSTLSCCKCPGVKDYKQHDLTSSGTWFFGVAFTSRRNSSRSGLRADSRVLRPSTYGMFTSIGGALRGHLIGICCKTWMVYDGPGHVWVPCVVRGAMFPQASRALEAMISHGFSELRTRSPFPYRDRSTFSQGDWRHSYVGFEGPSTF